MKKILILMLVIILTSCKTKSKESHRILKKDKMPNYYLILVKIDTIYDKKSNTINFNYYYKKINKNQTINQ